MPEAGAARIEDVIGRFPYRMAFAGGWIDQPFVSQHNPSPPGSMVVVALEPTSPFMARSGMGTSTRRVAAQLWGNELPARDPGQLTRELYEAENSGKEEPSGSQDMVGMIYPGINRLDYDFDHEGGLFPAHIASNNDPAVAQWLESIIWMVPVAPRPPGYNPLGLKRLDPQWVSRLGLAGRACFEAIGDRDSRGLGESMNETMRCWEAILPHTVRHPALQPDLMPLLAYFQQRYSGAMFSGCGGGYIYVVSEEPVPGGFRIKVRISAHER